MRVNYTTGDRKITEEINLSKRIANLSAAEKKFLNNLLQYGSAKDKSDAYRKFMKRYEKQLGAYDKALNIIEPPIDYQSETDTNKQEKKASTISKFRIPVPPNKSQDQFHINQFPQPPMPQAPQMANPQFGQMIPNNQNPYYAYMANSQAQGNIPINMQMQQGMYPTNMQQPPQQYQQQQQGNLMPGMYDMDQYQYHNYAQYMNNQQLMYNFGGSQGTSQRFDHQKNR